ncbi:hypothetical protein [uncultured Muribaculum sp.]|jgi:amino acid transporter|uniref:hypothetical protein n=1 Tax=uncultured Muribaculum sp. TaxID=1918613 RepID=UPI0025AFD249|nr:hypothetical protein [uncultured Muribaculum sp.]
MKELPWSFTIFLLSAFIFAAVFFDGGWICIIIAMALALLGLVVFYFEKKPVGRKARKDYTPRKFLSEWFGADKKKDTLIGLSFMVGIYAVMVLCFCGLLGCVNSCSNTNKHSRPYHNEKTGEGQYEYGGSREQKKDLERIDDYLEKHPNE